MFSYDGDYDGGDNYSNNYNDYNDHGNVAEIQSWILMHTGKIAKAIIGFAKSVCLSTWNNSVSTGWIFMKFDLRIFRKSVKKISVWLKPDKNNGYFT